MKSDALPLIYPQRMWLFQDLDGVPEVAFILLLGAAVVPGLALLQEALEGAGLLEVHIKVLQEATRVQAVDLKAEL